ncbi:hypothetical protein COLO4_10050 [Corchorus olitorius]|uniref:Uncharacterized protein n=1 Tax=Corchorus olitorius TaxID=93759 RepID=A0A1R3KA77_9ROSI|nr:hypothetical protein COLO4_10050 [Corchorus olitorius]
MILTLCVAGGEACHLSAGGLFPLILSSIRESKLFEVFNERMLL